MSRCGLGPRKYFEPEDFRDIPNFNTVPVIIQLGQAVSEACGQVLRRIEAFRETSGGSGAVPLLRLSWRNSCSKRSFGSARRTG